MRMWDRFKAWAGVQLEPVATAAHEAARPVREAASAQGQGDGENWRRLSGGDLASMNDRDLAPMAQDRMQKLAEYLWQSNLLANRLVELPLAYLLAEGGHAPVQE